MNKPLDKSETKMNEGVTLWTMGIFLLAISAYHAHSLGYAQVYADKIVAQYFSQGSCEYVSTIGPDYLDYPRLFNCQGVFYQVYSSFNLSHEDSFKTRLAEQVNAP